LKWLSARLASPLRTYERRRSQHTLGGAEIWIHAAKKMVANPPAPRLTTLLILDSTIRVAIYIRIRVSATCKRGIRGGVAGLAACDAGIRSTEGAVLVEARKLTIGDCDEGY